MKNNGTKKIENKRMPFVSPGVQGVKRFKPGTFTKVMSVFLVVISVCLLTIWLIQNNGYHLINNHIFYYLLGAAVAGVLVWAVYGARKLVKRPALKRTMTVSASIIAAIVLFYVLSYISIVRYNDEEYGRAWSPNHENELAIIRSPYIDFERILDEAHETYPDYTDEQIQEIVFSRLRDREDSSIISYAYKAYPIRGFFFYYTKAETSDDQLSIASDSEAELRVRWEDEDNAVLYAANPGPYDRGEFAVKCK